MHSLQTVQSDLTASFLFENGETGDAGERLRLGRQLTLWAERLGGGRGLGPHLEDSMYATLSSGSSSAQLHLPLAKLARKTGNPLLAGIHLHKASSNPVLISNSPVLNNLRVNVQGTKMVRHFKFSL